jgi:hypothetical protein
MKKAHEKLWAFLLKRKPEMAPVSRDCGNARLWEASTAQGLKVALILLGLRRE